VEPFLGGSNVAWPAPKRSGEAEPAPKGSGEMEPALSGSGETGAALRGSDEAVVTTLIVWACLMLITISSFSSGNLVLGPDINKKNKLQNPSVNCKTNLLSLINPLLAHVLP
jgi:hypothetical protein